jgi:hypothetical protein
LSVFATKSNSKEVALSMLSVGRLYFVNISIKSWSSPVRGVIVLQVIVGPCAALAFPVDSIIPSFMSKLLVPFVKKP